MLLKIGKKNFGHFPANWNHCAKNEIGQIFSIWDHCAKKKKKNPQKIVSKTADHI